MHPVLARKKWLGLYLAAWLPVALLLATLVSLSGPAPWMTCADPGAAACGLLCLSMPAGMVSLPQFPAARQPAWFRIAVGHERGRRAFRIALVVDRQRLGVSARALPRISPEPTAFSVDPTRFSLPPEPCCLSWRPSPGTCWLPPRLPGRQSGMPSR